jgi:hypothetical protein
MKELQIVFLPLAYIFIEGKSYLNYYFVFSKITELLCTACPKNIIIDIEHATYKCLSIIFPMPLLCFCNFHFGQAFYRQIQKCGLALLYSTNEKTICF